MSAADMDQSLQIIHEIVTSEESYKSQLELLQKFFMQPLKGQSILPQSLYTAIFGDILNLLAVSCELLHDLHQDQGVGRAFLKLIPYLKLYASYAKQYEEANALLQKWRKKSRGLGKLLENQESRPEVNCKITALLIAPVQRIPRYRLLLEELRKCMDQDHPDYIHIQSAVTEVEKVAKLVNDSVIEQDRTRRAVQIQLSLYRNRPKVVQPGRTYVREGVLKKVSRSGDTTHDRMFYLFNDILIYCKPRCGDLFRAQLIAGGRQFIFKPNSLECCCILPVKHCTVETVLGGHSLGGTVFKVNCRDECLILVSHDCTDARSWVEDIRRTAKQLRKNRQTLHKESSAKRPLRRSGIRCLKEQSLTQLRKIRLLQNRQAKVSTRETTTTDLPELREDLKESTQDVVVTLTNTSDGCKENREPAKSDTEVKPGHSPSFSSRVISAVQSCTVM